MTIPCNKNITKLLNSYTIRITITLQYLLQSTKRALRISDWNKLEEQRNFSEFLGLFFIYLFKSKRLKKLQITAILKL